MREWNLFKKETLSEFSEILLWVLLELLDAWCTAELHLLPVIDFGNRVTH